MNVQDFIPPTPYSFEQIVHGVMVGKVTNNKDPEKLGRVKVKLPLHEEQGETDWIRIATLMGGNSMGTLFIPEVDDEVLVAFHLGQLRHPFVIGMLWNDKHKPPAPDPDDKNNLRKIVSKSGHAIEFHDKSGEESIMIKTKKGQFIELADKDDHIKISEQGKGTSIEIKGGGSAQITIASGSNKIVIDNKGSITINSQQKVEIKSAQVNVEASATMTLKAGASLDIKSDGLINIKGSMVKIN